MIRTQVVVETYDVRLRQMFLPGGETYSWFFRNVRRPIHSRARKTAPRGRTGGLARAMASRQIGTNQYRIDIEVWNSAPYARSVHDGHLSGIIEGRPWLWVGAQGPLPIGMRRPRRMIEVAGVGHSTHPNAKGPQPWIRDAMVWGLARKGLL